MINSLQHEQLLKGINPNRIAKRQGGGDGYDKGGAYWGTPSNVWAVWAWVDGDAVCVYVRASSRADAISKATQ